MLIESWAKQKLQQITGGMFSDDDLTQMVQYSFTLSIPETKSYFINILGEDRNVEEFLNEFSLKRQPKQLQGAWKDSGKSYSTVLSELLPELGKEDVDSIIDQAKSLPKSEIDDYFYSLLGKSAESQQFVLQFKGMVEKEEAKMANQLHNKQPKPPGSKKKNKKKLQQEILKERIGNADSIQGRQIHDLIGNCINCGKIVCAFEGGDICPFCGVSFQVDFFQDDVFEAALSRRDTLIAYDRDSAARSHVTDMASDFDIGSDVYNKWLSSEARALALKKQQEMERIESEQKNRRVMTLDLENKRVLVEKSKVITLDITSVPTPKVEYVGHFRNPNLSKIAPKFISKQTQKSKKRFVSDETLSLKRLQDEMLYSMVEERDGSDYEPECG
jgi:hypothetical protein